MPKPRLTKHRQNIGLTFDPDKLARIRAFVADRRGNNLSAYLEGLAMSDPELIRYERETAEHGSQVQPEPANALRGK